MAVEPIPFGDGIENAINNFTKATAKRVFTDVGSSITRMLSTGTEPLFRRDLGERYFSGGSAANGLVLWFFTGVGSAFTGTSLPLIFDLIGLKQYSQYTHGFLIPAIVSLYVLYRYWSCAKANAKRLGDFRAEGKTYHSKSRGQPRWNPDRERAIKIGGSIFLLLFAPVTGVAFVISLYMSAGLAAKQQAALYDRYLDMLDAQIEGELLQDALLGKCPPEITFLYKPLPETLKPQLREDIAAAAVGKPVKIVAQKPKAKSSTTMPTPEPVMQS